MLLTLDEHETTSEAMRQVRIRSWGGALLGGKEVPVLLRFVRKPTGGPDEVRTMVTTAEGLCKAVGAVLPATVLAAHAISPSDSNTCTAAAVAQVWLPAASEGRRGTLLRLDGESWLRDEALRPVPDVDGRCLYLDIAR